MDLLEMTVDAGCAAVAPYEFTASGGEVKKVTVKMVMPLGGKESGLYRSPKAGEKVLVAPVNENNTIYYLVGYLPSANDAPFCGTGYDSVRNDVASDGGGNADSAKGFDAAQLNPLNMDGFIADSGMSLRYPKTGDKNTPEAEKVYNDKDNSKVMQDDPSDPKKSIDPTKKYSSTDQGLPYSEIGFYNKKSKFPLVNYELDRKKEKEDEKDEKATYYPHIDVLNIQSTGDIESRAANYHLVKAKRLEILAGDAAHEISPKTRADTAGAESGWNSDEVPIGDSPMEDPEVRGGDMHIRAEGKVIIKALKEIRLQVGRTVMVIDDGGFKVVSQKLNSAVALPGDTTLSLNPRTGISMSGQEVNIESESKFSLCDAWGAKMEGTVGSLSMGGLQISQSALDTAGLNALAVTNTLKLTQSITCGSLALTDIYRKSAVEIVNIVNVVVTVCKVLRKAFTSLLGFYKKYISVENKATVVAADAADASPPAAAPDIPTTTEPTPKMGDLEPIEQVIACLKMVLSITAAVYNAVDAGYGQAFKSGVIGSITQGKDNPWGAQAKSDFRDKLNLVALSIDAGIVDIAVGAYVIRGAGLAGAKISLNAGGSITLKAGEEKSLYASAITGAAVSAPLIAEKATKVVEFVSRGAEVVSDAVKITKDVCTVDPEYILYPTIEKL
ncbi:MAG: hypothetical protein LBF83_05345 [Spirochaetaceae bacterium]|jgi:hypothetical protein|nr:hypothetical protein [Spirochaetaceae bacterium]